MKDLTKTLLNEMLESHARNNTQYAEYELSFIQELRHIGKRYLMIDSRNMLDLEETRYIQREIFKHVKNKLEDDFNNLSQQEHSKTNALKISILHLNIMYINTELDLLK